MMKGTHSFKPLKNGGILNDNEMDTVSHIYQEIHISAWASGLLKSGIGGIVMPANYKIGRQFLAWIEVQPKIHADNKWLLTRKIGCQPKLSSRPKCYKGFKTNNAIYRWKCE